MDAPRNGVVNLMRHGGRHVPLLFALALAPALGETPGPSGYAADLLAEAPLSLDRDGNGVPDAWTEVREKGFRAYPGSIRVARDGVLELRMNARTVGVETLKGVSVQSSAGYRIEGRLRTANLREGSAELGVRWLDAEGRELGREVHVLPRSEAWTPFTVRISAIPGLARFAAIRLAARGNEVAGRVGYDAVRLFREPRFEIGGFQAGHLQGLPGPAELTVSIGGLDAGRYTLSGMMTDLDGLPTPWRWERELNLPSGTTRFPVEVGLHAPGAYRLRFSLSCGEVTVAVRESALSVFGTLPSAASRLEAGEGSPLGMLGAWISPDGGAAETIGALVDRLSPCAAAVEIRPPDSASSAWGQHPADVLLRRLSKQGVHRIGLLETVPGESPSHRNTVLRYLEEVDDWAFRVGPTKPWDAAGKQWDSIASWATTLPRPVRWGIAMEEAAAFPVGGGPPFSFAILPDGPETAAPVALWRVVGLPEGGSAADRVRNLALRALGEVFTGRSLFLRLDSAPGGLLEPDGAAKPEFLAWRNLSQVLRGARNLGTMPLGPGIEAHVIRRGSGAAILAWTTEPGRKARVLIPTATPVTSIDLMGGIRTLESADGTAALEIDALPRCFLVGSTGWLRTRWTMRLDGNVTAAAAPSPGVLSFENGFDTSLSGVLTLAAPKGWRVSPTSLPVSVERGGTFRAPVMLYPWTHEVTGSEGREMSLSVTLSYAEGGGGSMDVQVPFRLEPRGITAHLSTTHLADRGLVRITQRVMNRGDSELSLDVFVSVPGSAERRKPLGRLAPGEARVVEHILPRKDLDAGGALVGVREPSGARRFLVEGLPGP